MSHGPNALHIESSLSSSEAGVGFTDIVEMKLSDWTTFDGAILSASTTPEIAYPFTGIKAMKWDHNDDPVTEPARWGLVLPDWWAEKDQLRVRMLAAKFDASADENADLALTMSADYSTPGVDTGWTSITAPANQVLAAAGAALNPSIFAWYEFDFGPSLRAADARPARGDLLRFSLGMNETPGTTDMDVYVLDSPQLYLQRHASAFDRSKRLML